MNRKSLIIVSLVSLVALFVVAAQVYRSQRADEVANLALESAQLFEPASARRYGDPAARVVIVEFFDPACETCAELAPLLKAMVDDSGGRVRIVERYAPFHPGSDEIVALLEATRKQDKYWVALDILFTTQAQWAAHGNPQPQRLWALLEQGGLDVMKLSTDMKDPAIAALIAKDIQDARTLGVKATPEFFVNGKPLPTWGMKQLKDLVQSELAATY